MSCLNAPSIIYKMVFQMRKEALEAQLTQSRAESLSLAADLEAAEREAVAVAQAHEAKVRELEAELGLTAPYPGRDILKSA